VLIEKEAKEKIEKARQVFFEQAKQSFIDILNALGAEVQSQDFSKVARFTQTDVDLFYANVVLPLLGVKAATTLDIRKRLKQLKELLISARALPAPEKAKGYPRPGASPAAAMSKPGGESKQQQKDPKLPPANFSSPTKPASS
jgi:hypothetical protein